MFLTPRVARAAMVAGARQLGPLEVLAIADGASPGSAAAQARAVSGFLAALLPRLSPGELLRGAIEIAAMRHFPADADSLERVAEWAIQRAARADPETAEEVAIHYIVFGGDTYPTRHSAGVAVDISARMLRELGRDCSDRLLRLGETGNHIAVRGLMQAFGTLGEQRAVPFIAGQLSDNRKMVRVAAIDALGMIGTSEAREAVQTVSGDRRKVVQRAIDQALGR